MPELRNYSIYLLKEGETPASALEVTQESLLALRDDIAPGGYLYARNNVNPDGPKWAPFVRNLTTENCGSLDSASSSAVAFILQSNRWLAFTFGYGRTLLRADCYEPRFGLKVAVNRVDADKLKTVDARTFEDAPFHTRRQSFHDSPLDLFGFDAHRDLVSLVGGKPRDREFANFVAGRDSVTISKSFDPTFLPQFCQELLDAYEDNQYKERFGWIDQLREITSQPEIDDLNDRLTAALNGRNLDSIDLAPPEIIDHERLAGFRYSTGDKSTLETDLSIERFLDSLGDALITTNGLKAATISYYLEDSASAVKKWDLYKCISAQIAVNGKQFVLNVGDWFEVDSNLVQEISRYLEAELPYADIDLPSCETSITEEDYNYFTCEFSDDFLLQDQVLVNIGGSHGKVEPCDIFTRSGQLIHVKRKSRSSTLSHLFAQAIVSAELLEGDASFLRKWKTNIVRIDRSYLRALHRSRFPRDRYEVIFAIITPEASELRESLPFFARLHLMQTVRQLKQLGFKVSLAGVEGELNEVPKAKTTRKRRKAAA